MSSFKPMSDAEFDKLVAKHDREGGALAKQGATDPQGCWDAGIKIIRGCGHMEIPAYLIRLSQKAHEQIECLKRAYPSLEWLAYLEGAVDHDKREVMVETLIIPDSQIVTGSHVGEVEYGWNEGKQICGVIHSHNTMGAFFSGTDDAYINQNHDVSICVSTARGREICAQVRVKTPCGSYVINSNINFKVEYSTILDEAAFVAEFSPKIRTPRLISSYSRPALLGGRGVRDVNSVRGGESANDRPTIRPLNPIEDASGLDEKTVKDELMKFYTATDIDAIEKSGGIEGLRDELEHCYSLLGATLAGGYTDEDPDNVFNTDEPQLEGDGWDIELLDAEDVTVLEETASTEVEETVPEKIAVTLN